MARHIRQSRPTLYALLYGFRSTKLALFLFSIGLGIALLPVKLIGIILIGSGLILISLSYPPFGLYLLIPAIPFSSLLQVSIGKLTVGPMEVLLSLMLGTWLITSAAKQTFIMPHPPLLWPFVLFLGAISLSWLNTFSAVGSLIETAKWIEMLVLYLFIMAHAAQVKPYWLISLCLLSGLAEAILGLYQFIFKVGPEGFLLFGGEFLRAYGTFRQPNPYAGYLGLILPLALAITLWHIDQIRNQSQKFSRNHFYVILLAFITIGATSLLLVALYASQSRGAWLGFSLAFVITLLALGRHWAVLLISGLIGGAGSLALGGLSILPTSLLQRFIDVLPLFGAPDLTAVKLTGANFSALERLAHWQVGLDMWRDQVWLGVGFGNYEPVYGTYAIGQWQDPLGHAHNYLLNLGAEIGYIGLVGYLIFWIWIFIYGLILLRRSQAASEQQAVLAGSIGILTHLHTHNLLDNLYVQGMYLHIAIILGIMTLVGQNQQRGDNVNVHGSY